MSKQRMKPEHIFLSHNSADTDYCSKLAAALTATGAHVWFDKWRVKPGDSIPLKIESGLQGCSIFVLVWSANAESSPWVRTEVEAALARYLKAEGCRLVPIILDDTPIPLLIRSLHHINARTRDPIGVAKELLGIESDAQYRIAVQHFINEAGLTFQDFPGVGVLVGCPRCGAPLRDLEGWEQIDELRDDRYMGSRCKACGWNDGSEV